MVTKPPDPESPSSGESHGAGQHAAALRTESFFVSESYHCAGLEVGEHEHQYGCVNVVLDGQYSESSKGGTFDVPAGGSVVKPPGARHWNSFCAPARSLRVELPPRAWSAARAAPDAPAKVDDPRARILAEAMRRELRARDDCSGLVLEGLCYELLGLVLRRLNGRGRESARGPGRTYVRDGAEYLRERFRDGVSFSVLAEHLGVNRTQLAQAFRREMGCTMGEFVRALRVSYVQRALSETSLPIAQVALDAGFADQSHCSRVFRELVGCSPSRWRAERRP